MKIKLLSIIIFLSYSGFSQLSDKKDSLDLDMRSDIIAGIINSKYIQQIEDSLLLIEGIKHQLILSIEQKLKVNDLPHVFIDKYVSLLLMLNDYAAYKLLFNSTELHAVYYPMGPQDLNRLRYPVQEAINKAISNKLYLNGIYDYLSNSSYLEKKNLNQEKLKYISKFYGARVYELERLKSIRNSKIKYNRNAIISFINKRNSR